VLEHGNATLRCIKGHYDSWTLPEIFLKSLLSKTDRNLATRVANGGFGCPELEI
jgi:hypothetical protein